MKWSWKTFGLQLITNAVLGLALAYLVSMAIDARRGPGGADSTLLSLAVGGFLGSIMLAALSGWKGWGLAPLLVAGFIVSAFYSSNPGRGIITLMFAPPIYFAAYKVRMFTLYYFPAKTPEANEPSSKNDRDQTPKA